MALLQEQTRKQMAESIGKDSEETSFPFLPLSSEVRLAPWFHYTAEEKSYVIYNAYLKRVLRSDDLKKFSLVNRLVNWNYWFFPVVAYPIVRRFLIFTRANSLLLKSPAPVYYFTQFAIIGVSWLLWINFNPFYKYQQIQQEALLNVIYNRIGLNCKKLNDVLPRYWTEQEINRKTLALYNERNGFFAGYLYPYEESAEPLVDINTWPKYLKPGKNTK